MSRNSTFILIFFTMMTGMISQAHAGGSFMGPEDRALMCLAVNNTASSPAGDTDCDKPIVTKDGSKFCPHPKPTLVCAELLAETEPLCELNGEGNKRCEIMTPGQAIQKSLDEQLKEAP